MYLPSQFSLALWLLVSFLRITLYPFKLWSLAVFSTSSAVTSSFLLPIILCSISVSSLSLLKKKKKKIALWQQFCSNCRSFIIKHFMDLSCYPQPTFLFFCSSYVYDSPNAYTSSCLIPSTTSYKPHLNSSINCMCLSNYCIFAINADRTCWVCIASPR